MLDRIVSAAQMQALDRAAIEDYGIPGIVLMENAGAGATREILDFVGENDLASGVLILCGKGNNAGDGYVIARHLHNRGVPVTIAMPGEPTTACPCTPSAASSPIWPPFASTRSACPAIRNTASI